MYIICIYIYIYIIGRWSPEVFITMFLSCFERLRNVIIVLFEIFLFVFYSFYIFFS